MNCGIHRVEKRSRQAIGGLQAEANRDAGHEKNFEGSDIDWSRTRDNIHLVTSDNWLRDINETIARAGIKSVRKDAILMLDGLYTASPEFFQGKSESQIRAYFEQCLGFHVRAYCHGDASLVKNAVIHMDETTPHMQVCSVPITPDGRLSAKDVMGNKKQYNERQDAFFEEVTKQHGLERGYKREHGSTRKHRDQMEYKAELAEKKLLERVDELEIAQHQLAETLDAKAKASRIKKVNEFFKKPETVTYDASMMREIETIQQDILNKMQASFRAENQAKKLSKENEEKLKEIEELQCKAQENYELAKKYREDLEGYIIGTAENLLDKQVDKVIEQVGKREERLINFMAQYSQGDKTLIQIFGEQEKERLRQIKEDAKRKFLHQRLPDEQERQQERDDDFDIGF